VRIDTDTSLYTLLLEEPGALPADRFAVQVVESAMEDPVWRSLHDAVIDDDQRYPEGAPAALVKAPEWSGASILQLPFAELGSGLAELPDYVGALVGDPGWPVRDLDRAAAAVAARAWCAAAGTHDLLRTPSLGPASVLAVSAACCRWHGEPVDLPVPSGLRIDPAFTNPRVDAAVSELSDWLFWHVPAEDRRTVLDRAVCDLTFRGYPDCAPWQVAARLHALTVA
jgi:hypothetical protein